jgi:hypothetical protein
MIGIELVRDRQTKERADRGGTSSSSPSSGGGSLVLAAGQHHPTVAAARVHERAGPDGGSNSRQRAGRDLQFLIL